MKTYTKEQVKLDVTIAMVEKRGLQFNLPQVYSDVYKRWLKQPQAYKDKIRQLAEKYDAQLHTASERNKSSEQVAQNAQEVMQILGLQ